MSAAGHIDLTLSNPTRADLPYELYAPVWAALSRAVPGYDPDPLGLLAARQAVVEHWPGQPKAARADRVLLLPSSSDAYDYVFTLLCDEGDGVLVPEPSYPLLAHIARYTRVTLQPYRLSYDGAWHIDFDSVRHARGPRTRAIVLVSPNNPTGSYTSAREFRELDALGLPIVSDEVFARYPLSERPGRAPSALGATDCLTFAIDGLSKSAGLPQLKLGWFAVSGPDAAVDEAMRRSSWLADTYLPVSTPVQAVLPELLEHAAAFRRPLLARLRENIARLASELHGSAATLLASEGGWYAVIRLPAIASEEEWVLGLARGSGVLSQPGYFYDFTTEAPHLVLSLLPPEATFARGARAIRLEVERRLGL
jgi:alanine-synthesizing transaminase